MATPSVGSLSDSLFTHPSPTFVGNGLPYTVAEDVPLQMPSPSQIELPPTDGFTGMPHPYTPRTDDGLTVLLLFCGFLIAHILTHFRHHLSESVKAFFRPVPADSNRAERTGTEVRGRFFVLLEVSFCFGLLFYDNTETLQYEQTFSAMPRLTIALAAGLVFVCTVLKLGLYRIVNAVFFTTDRAERWTDAYLLVYLFAGTLLLPVTLAAVYLDLPHEQQILAFIVIAAATELLLLYRLFRTFCRKFLDALHIFLYFCTLELIPALVLWRVLFWLNGYISEIL